MTDDKSVLMRLKPEWELDPMRAGGQPVVSGTRVPVANMLAEYAEGYVTLNELADDMRIDRDKLAAAILKAAELVSLQRGTEPLEIQRNIQHYKTHRFVSGDSCCVACGVDAFSEAIYEPCKGPTL